MQCSFNTGSWVEIIETIHFWHSWHFYRGFTLKSQLGCFFFTHRLRPCMPDLIQGMCFLLQLKKLLKKDGERGWCFRNTNIFCHVLFMYLQIINDSDVYRKQSLASWSVTNYDFTCLQPSLIIVLYYKVWILSCMNWQPQNWKLPMQAAEWLMLLQGSCPQWRRQARPQGKCSSLPIILLFLRVVWNVRCECVCSFRAEVPEWSKRFRF